MQTAIHLQIILTHWTKQSRGAPGATMRARVPLYLPVESQMLKRGQLSVEIINYRESDAFEARRRAPQLQSLEALPFTDGTFSLHWDGRDARTQWHWRRVGLPTPKIFDERAGQIEVPPDNWIRLRWHERQSDFDCGIWGYEQTVINIARCDTELKADFAGEPSQGFEWLPPLR